METEAQLRRLVIGSNYSASVSSSEAIKTPTMSVDTAGDSESRAGDSNNTYAAKRWEDALRRCRDKLQGDYETVSKFDSPEKLLAGLDEIQRQQQAESSSSLSALLAQVLPTQRSIKELGALFIASMLPHSVTAGLAWGLLYLCVKLCADHDSASKRLTEVLSKIRRQFAVLNRFASRITDQDEICIAFIDIFEALILLWSDCVKFFRTHPPGSSGDYQGWTKLEPRIKETTDTIDDTMKYLERLLSLSAGGQPYQSSSYRAGKGQPHLHEVETAFPVVLLRHSANTQFVGRSDYLDDISAYFRRGAAAGKNDDLCIYSICGIGGVGKTELALQYAKQHAHEYDALLWVRAETVESLRQDFTKIAMALKIPGAHIDGDPTNNLSLVHLWFREIDRPWLLIFDNMEKFKDLQAFIPFDCRGSVIITTRYQSQAQLCRRKHRVLKPLSNIEAQTLFMELLGRPEDDQEHSPAGDLHQHQAGDKKSIDHLSSENRDAVCYLLEQMDGLVLGIHQIAALIRFQDLTDDIAKFADRYKRQPQRLLGKSDGIEGHTLATLWEMSFALISPSKNINAWLVLGIISFLQADEIPTAIFLPTGDVTFLDEELSFCKDGDDVDEAVDALKAMGLVERKKNKISLHRLVQTAFLFSLTPEQQQKLFDYTCALMNHIFPVTVQGEPMYGQWEACSEYYQHAQSLALFFSRLKAAKCPLVASDAFSSLMTNCAWHLFERGTQREALGLVDIAIEACTDKGLVYAHLLNTAMMSHFKLNDMVNAGRVLDESRAIREKLLKADDQNLATTLGNVGTLEVGEGRLDEAYAHHQQCLAIRLRDPSMGVLQGVAHVNLGRIDFLKGNYAAAAEHYETCEKLFLQNGGPDGFLMVGINYAWGNLKAALGDLEDAKVHFNKCLETLLRQTPGELKVASTCFKIGCLELQMENFQAAMDALSRGLGAARARGEDGRGEEARILRKQAEALERCAPHVLDDVLKLADMADPEHLRGEAETIRRRLGQAGLDGSIYSNVVGDEELAYNNLVNPFDR
ncbi:hypothetical protein B0T17DRAFT_407350 [Bombardia bombarda]|uniref:NB-ARC domain-containing protein n=1 Tax=Bombardia bombarda TaxID=252184 RepID=A0AA39WAQ3_9PEZI|nr:hypothetical protein B0T17DRAFT_407350 [Bombardia bombarda]